LPPKTGFDDISQGYWNEQFFDAQGRLVLNRDSVYGGGVFSETAYDAANTKSWSFIHSSINSVSGQTTWQLVTNDDGSTTSVYPTGEAPETVVEPDGTAIIIMHAAGDPPTTGTSGSSGPAVVSSQLYSDPQGRYVGRRDNYSDGSYREQHFDVPNTQTWSKVTNWFDANAQLTHERIDNRDGTRIEIFPRGQFATTGVGDPLATFTQQSFDAQGRLVGERDNIIFGSHVEVAYNYSPTAYIKKQVTYFLPTGVAQYRTTWDRLGIQRTDAFDSSYYSAPIHDPYALFNTATPVVLDLANKGASDMLSPLSTSNSTFDMVGDGQQHRTAWASSGEGVLAIDADGDGKINQRQEVVFTDWAPGTTSDMQALEEVFDTNHNGKLDASDMRWKDFRVLVDGKTETLDQLNIASIDLTPQGNPIGFSDGSSINGTSMFTRTDGSTGLAGDAAFRYDTVPVSGSAVAESNLSAVQAQAAAQLNQLIGAMASFAPPASAQTALAAANDSRLQAAPLLAAAH
jgi:YD repeat-containing protein